MDTEVVRVDNEEGFWERMADKFYWPCYRWTRDRISPIWYRFFGYKFHIVKTKLTPASWIDTEERILYAVMALVEWFVENDMMKMSKEYYEEELERINKENDPEYKQYYIDSWTEQYETDCKIVKIYDWWKNYPNRQKEIEKAMIIWFAYMDGFKPDKNRIWWDDARKNMNESQKEEEKRLNDVYNALRDKLENEEQEMLKLAIELRKYMWS